VRVSCVCALSVCVSRERDGLARVFTQVLLRGFMTRRQKATVLTQLPSKVRQEVRRDLAGFEEFREFQVLNFALQNWTPLQRSSANACLTRAVCVHCEIEIEMDASFTERMKLSLEALGSLEEKVREGTLSKAFSTPIQR
jgi:hypothetical protein